MLQNIYHNEQRLYLCVVKHKRYFLVATKVKERLFKEGQPGGAPAIYECF